MSAAQIVKLVFFGILVLLAIAFFVVSFILAKEKEIDFKNKRARILVRVRVGLFLGMLVCLLVMVILA